MRTLLFRLGRPQENEGPKAGSSAGNGREPTRKKDLRASRHGSLTQNSARVEAELHRTPTLSGIKSCRVPHPLPSSGLSPFHLTRVAVWTMSPCLNCALGFGSPVTGGRRDEIYFWPSHKRTRFCLTQCQRTHPRGWLSPGMEKRRKELYKKGRNERGFERERTSLVEPAGNSPSQQRSSSGLVRWYLA